MRNSVLYLSWLLLLLASCEEYYTPAIDKSAGRLVVDAQITNDPSKNYVHLTTSRDYYSESPVLPVSGAKVELIQSTGVVISGSESGTGYFNFGMVPVSGKQYKLRITLTGDVYESEVVTMPPLPTMGTWYTENKETKTYKTDSYGVPRVYTTLGREVYTDLPVSTALSNYRFYVRSVIEWAFYAPSTGGMPPPPVFGWESYVNTASYNLAGDRILSAATNKIEKHPLVTISYNAQNYLHADSLTSVGWIILVDQFGTSAGSFEYHQKLNSQFAAEGSLFDPVQTQIYGNITCKTDPSKMVFGYFDLNSYRQVRYYMNLSSPAAAVVLRQIYRYPFIPDNGKTKGYPPDWWE